MNSFGQLDRRLTTVYQGFSHQDPAPNRVKPLPIQVLHKCQELVAAAPSPMDMAIMDLLWIGFFFLLRPGEYLDRENNSPFQLKHLKFMRGLVTLDHMTCAPLLLQTATHVSITFDTQKNRRRGEVIAHGTSGHSIACPVRALGRRVLALRTHNASLTTKICTYYHHGQPKLIVSPDCQVLIRQAVTLLPNLNYEPKDVTTRSLRSGGAMALLCGRVDITNIRLVGRWASDCAFQYLHAQALPVINKLSRTMVTAGAFTLLPGQTIAQEAVAILQETGMLQGNANQTPAAPQNHIIAQRTTTTNTPRAGNWPSRRVLY